MEKITLPFAMGNDLKTNDCGMFPKGLKEFRCVDLDAICKLNLSTSC